jgi:hypothetical protein
MQTVYNGLILSRGYTMGISDDIAKNADNAAKEFANKQRAKAAAKKKGNSP